ncbi:MAG: hypothetical protein MPJ50_12190 [Pirellulales bacterium]|nr:hypothetical protein [Pirellulales bacterium]
MTDTLARTKERMLLRLRLARACEIRNRKKDRDKLLVLAGVDARRLGWNPIAAYCRKKILAHNAGHLINKYRSFAEAVECEDFQQFLRRLEREYGSERVEQLLLDANMPEHPRQELDDDFEYAAALLGTSRQQLESANREPQAEELPPIEEQTQHVQWNYLLPILLGLAAVTAWLLLWWLS